MTSRMWIARAGLAGVLTVVLVGVLPTAAHAEDGRAVVAKAAAVGSPPGERGVRALPPAERAVLD